MMAPLPWYYPRLDMLLQQDDEGAYAAFTPCFDAYVDTHNQDQLQYTLNKRLCVPIGHNMSTANQSKVDRGINGTQMKIIPLEDPKGGSTAGGSQANQQQGANADADDADK